MSGKNTPIKSALLDQRIVSGLGNIYVCEVLFRARLSPTRKAGKIARARTGALVPIVREVLSDAIEAGGSSLRDYRQADGELGYFQHRFQVYDREGEACVTPDCNGTITRITQLQKCEKRKNETAVWTGIRWKENRAVLRVCTP